VCKCGVEVLQLCIRFVFVVSYVFWRVYNRARVARCLSPGYGACIEFVCVVCVVCVGSCVGLVMGVV